MDFTGVMLIQSPALRLLIHAFRCSMRFRRIPRASTGDTRVDATHLANNKQVTNSFRYYCDER